MKRIVLFLATNLAIIAVLNVTQQLREKMIGALRRLAAAHPAPLPDQLAAFGIAGGVAHGAPVVHDAPAG